MDLIDDVGILDGSMPVRVTTTFSAGCRTVTAWLPPGVP